MVHKPVGEIKIGVVHDKHQRISENIVGPAILIYSKVTCCVWRNCRIGKKG